MTPKPRYAPARPLPPYAYVPGRTPHPVNDPRGHAFGRREPVPPYLAPDRWRENADYLYGVDCFNAGFFWEAHEAWEGVWKAARGSDEVQAAFVQGLIQVAAAWLKRSMAEPGGAARLAHDALEQLRAVADRAGPVSMGLDLPGWLERAAAALATSDPAAAPPRISLEL